MHALDCTHSAWIIWRQCRINALQRYLTLTYLFLAVPNYLQNCSFEQEFSPGDFISVSQERSRTEGVEDEQPSVEKDGYSSQLFTCPNEGCVKAYQRHSSLEKHLSFGQCKMVPERHTLLDVAKMRYHALLVEGASAAVSGALEGDTSETVNTLPEGWALKAGKTATRFSDAQRKYLEEKFNLGQATGQKQDPATVSRDMRFAKKMDGSRLFKREEYLSPQQVQSFFSRMAARSRQDHGDLSEADITAAQDEQLFDDTRQAILQQVQLRHPIVYDNLDICALYRGKRLKQLSIAMLNTICDYFDMSTEAFNVKRKAEYIAALSELVLACDCNKSSK